MVLWRLTRRAHADLGGRGGLVVDGRWHTRGRPIVYCATSAALAVLEVRVHLDLAPHELPDDYVLMKVAVPDDLETRTVSLADLPAGWRDDEELSRPVGDAWLAGRATPLLEVPSAIVDVERNVLLNPAHDDTTRMTVEIAPFGRRLFRP